MNWLKNFINKIIPVSSSSEDDSKPYEVANDRFVDQEFIFDLEESLLRSDCGIDFTEQVLKLIQGKDLKVSQAQNLVLEYCLETLKKAENNIPSLDEESLLIFMVGVNGAGKTTSSAKLANMLFKQKKKKSLFVPCDTFRAAAAEQLTRWSQRVGLPIHESELKRPDAILFEAIKLLEAKEADVLIVDTAGRLQNKTTLMEELSKLSKTAQKHIPSGTKILTYLVLDASTGQNGYQQALLFKEATSVDGIILTKFDGSYKGGIIFAIAHGLSIPICFVGTGEGLEDFKPFKADDYVKDFIFYEK
jgi:fused signal recognition particle receptor